MLSLSLCFFVFLVFWRHNHLCCWELCLEQTGNTTSPVCENLHCMVRVMVFPMIVPARTQLLSSVFAVFVRWMCRRHSSSPLLQLRTASNQSKQANKAEQSRAEQRVREGHTGKGETKTKQDGGALASVGGGAAGALCTQRAPCCCMGQQLGWATRLQLRLRRRLLLPGQLRTTRVGGAQKEKQS